MGRKLIWKLTRESEVRSARRREWSLESKGQMYREDVRAHLKRNKRVARMPSNNASQYLLICP
jgi:hypothetical protein